MNKIAKLSAHEILDSRGNPTVEAVVTLDNGLKAKASCPSGASIGKYEALELRDNDEKRFHGMGVLTAIRHIETLIAQNLVGKNAENQPEIDNILIQLDGTKTMSNLGANATLPVSMAVARASCQSLGIPLFAYLRKFLGKTDLPKVPAPLFNLINGGKHGNAQIDFQEYFVIPAASKGINDSVFIGATVYHALSEVLKQKGYSTLVGDEGGFSPNIQGNTEGFSLLKQAIQSAGFELGLDVFLGLDAASSTFYNEKEKAYTLHDKQNKLTSDDLINYYKELNNQYHLLYLEDPLSEDDWKGFSQINKDLSQNTIVVGDDLTVTNPQRLQMAIEQHAISGIIIKPNQIGTITQAMAVHEMAKTAGLKTIVSHRSGETTDDFIADFAVALSSDYVKFGAPARGERVVKYNRLLEIERELNAH